MEMKEIYQKIKELDEKAGNIEERIKKTDDQINEAFHSKQAVDDISRVEEDTEILVPVVNGIFVKARLVDGKNMKVNIGSDVVSEKSTDETKRLLDEQIKELRQYRDKLSDQFDKVLVEMRTMEEKADVQISKEKN